MEGGDNNDTYYVGSAGDTVIEQLNGGTDEVNSSISYVLTANVEDLVLEVGAGDIDGTGNSLDNEITGNGGDNELLGLAGNDSLYGLGGNDTLDGGTGADTMEGGTGDDTYIVDNLGDSVGEVGGSGDDTVFSSVDFDLGAAGGDVENLVLTGTAEVGIGNGLDNQITGNGFDNSLLSGLAGEDTISGGGGDDTIIGGTGDDTMTGGSSSDTFMVLAESGVSGTEEDHITDFEANAGSEDVLDLSDLLASGTFGGGGLLGALFGGFVDIDDDGTHTTITVDLNGGNNDIDYTIVLDNTVENALTLANNLVVE
jgi:Ca2+-binding RTX toxin-like protein